MTQTKFKENCEICKNLPKEYWCGNFQRLTNKEIYEAGVKAGKQEMTKHNKEPIYENGTICCWGCWYLGYGKGQEEALKEELEFLQECFLDKSLICSIDGLAEKLDGDELILIHKLITLANEQNKQVIKRISKLKEGGK